ncbi:YkyA family protein [Virgibacillus sp. C22-A2]|uniref:YkyA family protein n=1 Tax=Virgibacillus tibetensis TaxID=3042313 RepID=A0ABU6KN31_9BACI|nr:YkyA family protein [Virgibacillus sp. C22-A2]
MLRRRKLFVLIISLLAFLSACSSESTEEKIHSHLQEAVELEKGFEEQQKEITELERQEQELYSQIINLGMEDFEKIQELSQQAIEIIEQRSEKIDLEKESIAASEVEFTKTADFIDDLEEQEVKDTASTMFDVMNNRYSAYYALYDAYTESLMLEEQLYTMLQQEDIQQEDLTEQINTINNSYQEVLEANDQFNEGTVEYNALKKEYYELAGIDVSYEENPAGGKSDSE